MNDLQTFLKTKVPVISITGPHMIPPEFNVSVIEETDQGLRVMLSFWHAQNSDVFECFVNGNTITPI